MRCGCAVTFVAGIFFFLSAAPDFAAQADEAGKGFRSVALSPYANPAEGTARQFSMLPTGAQNFHGVPFRVDSRLAVTGMESARPGEFFPTEITGIKVGGNVKRIHLLHGTMFADKDGVPVAKIIFHFADGSEESARIGYGVHVRAWIAPRLEKKSELVDPNSQIAWADADDRRGTSSRIFQTAIENPKPSQTITSIDFVSMFSRAAPFIVAVTAEDADSKLPPNRPMPLRKVVRELNEFDSDVYRREITVRVTDGPSGGPAKNAVVSLGISDDKESFFFGESKPDAQGICRMPYPPQHAVGLNIWVHAPDRAPTIISESKTNRVKFSGEYAVTLKPGNTVGGVVKDPSGKGITGAEVVIYKINRISAHHYGRVDYDSVLSGADGKWTSRSLPDDLSGFSFQVTHPEFRPALFVTAGYAPPPTNTSSSTIVSSSSPVSYRRLADGTLVPIESGGLPRRATPRASGMPLLTSNALLSASAEMVLQPAILVTGTALDVNGKPLTNTEVIFQQNTPMYDRKFLRTDAQGHFRTMASAPGNATLNLILEGYTPAYSIVSVRPNMPPVEIRLAPPHVLHGRVVDRQQRPVPGARVRVDEWQGTTDLVHFQALTDAQGSFVWTGAPIDQVTFYVSKTNFSNTRHSFSGKIDNITIPITRAPGVYGKVIDADTKKPIPSFTVIPGRKYSPSETRINWDRSDSGRGYNGEYSLRMSSYYFQPEGRVLVEAPGYEPQISQAFTGMDSYVADFALKKGKGITCVVQLPDGSPAVGATLVLVEKGESAFLDLNGNVRGNGGSADAAHTDMQGKFEFVPKLEPQKIYVTHEQGFAEANAADISKGGKIVLQKWGRIQGVMRVGNTNEPDSSSVRLQNDYQQYVADSDGRITGLSFSLKADPDSDGNFVFEKVPPGEQRIAVEYRFKDDRDGELPLSHGFFVAVKPGETANVTLGGTGRQVTGRVKVVGGDQSDVDWKRDVHRLSLELPPIPGQPMNLRGARQLTETLFLGGLNVAPQPVDPKVMREHQRAERQYVLLFDTNGNFRVDNVPPGKYMLSINVSDPEDEYYNRRIIGSAGQEVTVPDDKNAKVNAPFDIGTMELKITPRLKIGKIVPDFEAKTRDGKSIKLSSYRGKPVLMHFWGLSLGYSTYDLQALKDFQNTYAGKLTILGFNLDNDAANAEQFAKSQGMTWTQTYLGQWNMTPVPAMFGINGNSACVLVDAEGRLASQQLRGTAIRNTVNNLFTALE